MQTDKLEIFWQEFLSTLLPESPAHAATYTAEGFGDSPEMADELGALITAGIKTATCSALWEWQVEGEQLPQPGQFSIVLDGQGHPLAVIETIQVQVQAFNQVDADFAYEEGEGDRSFEYWRAAHWRFFSRSLPKIRKQVVEDMPLVCERFRLCYVRRTPI